MKQVAEHKDTTMLQSVSKIYGEEAKRRRDKGQRHQGYELVQDVAGFKAEVQALSLKRARETARRKRSGLNNAFLLSARFQKEQDLNYKARKWQFADGKSTLAVENKNHLIRYIVSGESLQHIFG